VCIPDSQESRKIVLQMSDDEDFKQLILANRREWNGFWFWRDKPVAAWVSNCPRRGRGEWQSHDSVMYLVLNRQQAIERLFLVEEEEPVVEEEEQKMRSRQAMAHWPCGFACTCRRVICPDVRNGSSERGAEAVSEECRGGPARAARR
jgi:hypothetical protein